MPESGASIPEEQLGGCRPPWPSGIDPNAVVPGFVLRLCGNSPTPTRGVGFTTIRTGRTILRPGNGAVSGQEQIGP